MGVETLMADKRVIWAILSVGVAVLTAGTGIEAQLASLQGKETLLHTLAATLMAVCWAFATLKALRGG